MSYSQLDSDIRYNVSTHLLFWLMILLLALTHYSPPTDPYLKILYRDNDIVVFEKPSGLLSVRGKSSKHQDSLQYRAETVWPGVGVVHRLDMSTSGIMIMALNKFALSELGKQFQQRKTDKRYIAKVWGHPETDEGRVDLPLKVDWPNRPKQKVCLTEGKPSETLWRCLSKEVDKAGNQVSRIELTPITGRSHQLRVHLAQIGLPILGDKFYAHEKAFAAAARLLLHAQSLTLRHPRSDEQLCFDSECPF